MAEDPNIHPAWAAETKNVARVLDRLDYYQVLGAPPDAPLEDLKRRYHQLQRNYHPDSFFNSPDRELREAVLRIAKRVAEAYVILRDPEKRALYDQRIQGPDRDKHLRYTEESDQERRKAQLEAAGKTPQGQNLFRKAQESIAAGNLDAAARDLRTALIFEPDSELFKRTLDDLMARKSSSS
jgi:curved DNA-binding protein CbpA